MENEHFLYYFQIQLDTICASFIWTQTKQAMKASGKVLMQHITAMLALRDVRGTTDSTCSFTRKLVIWVKQGNITQFNQGDTTHLSKKTFLKIQLSRTILSQVGWEHPYGWFSSRRPSQSKSVLVFPSVHAMAYLRSYSDTYSVCFSRDASCNLGEAVMKKLHVTLC